MTITILYSCPICQLYRAPCDVPIREAEDVLAWLDQTIRLLGQDHHRRSPDCHPTSLHDVMIPTTRTDKIGGPPLQ